LLVSQHKQKNFKEGNGNEDSNCIQKLLMLYVHTALRAVATIHTEKRIE